MLQLLFSVIETKIRCNTNLKKLLRKAMNTSVSQNTHSTRILHWSHDHFTEFTHTIYLVRLRQRAHVGKLGDEFVRDLIVRCRALLLNLLAYFHREVPQTLAPLLSLLPLATNIEFTSRVGNVTFDCTTFQFRHLCI